MTVHDDIVKRFEETSEKIKVWKKASKSQKIDDSAVEKPVLKIAHLPSEDIVGVNNSVLQLCATIAGGVYSADSKNDFIKLLKENAQIQEHFSDLTVHFYQNGITVGKGLFPEQLSLDAPTFTFVTTGDTLIMGWRGTVSINDMVADAKIDSVGPWKALAGLEVQEAYYKLIKNTYFKSHYKDIINMVGGKYSKVPGKNAKDGTPIKKIYLTGHSLGGGLAQVAHLCLRARGDLWPGLFEAVENVEVKTIAISAPMTTVVMENPSTEVTSFLEDIAPHMRNIFYNADVVPRGYSELIFIDRFVNAFLGDSTLGSEGAAKLAKSFVTLVFERLKNNEDMMKQAELFRQVGKLIYYADADAEPVICVDPGFFGDGPQPASGETSFRDLIYGPDEDVATAALDNHMVLVTGPGLTFT